MRLTFLCVTPQGGDIIVYEILTSLCFGTSSPLPATIPRVISNSCTCSTARRRVAPTGTECQSKSMIYIQFSTKLHIKRNPSSFLLPPRAVCQTDCAGERSNLQFQHFMSQYLVIRVLEVQPIGNKGFLREEAGPSFCIDLLSAESALGQN